MSESFYNPENIEAYITNKMSAAEKVFFEHELAKDPLLHNEIDLQKDIVEALKSNRKAQLKNRLNNIQIDNTVNYTGLKVAASVLFAGLISFGGYNLITSHKQNNIAINNTSTVVTSPEKTTAANNYSKEKEEVVIIGNEKENNTNSTQNNIKGTVISKNQTGGNTTYTRTTRTITTTQTVVEPNNPTFDTPEVKGRYDEGDAIRTDNNINMPKGDVGNSNGEASLDNLKVKTVKDKNHNLFYQYYNNKLFLYGDFDSKPYEILELNTVRDKQLYLYFENKYYNLKQNQIDITALTVIKDKETFSNLELIRNK
jgi:hypothetical protein